MTSLGRTTKTHSITCASWLMTVALALATTTCSTAASYDATTVTTAPFTGTIHLARNPWLASEVDCELAQILLTEQLGIAADVIDIDEYTQWPELAAGQLHATLEVWPSGHADDITKYVDTGQVEDAGALGPVGRIGWYIPTYMLDAHPELATYQGLRDPDNSALFATPATQPHGQFLAGDPTWTQYDGQIITNLSLDFEVVQSGSEDATIAAMADAFSHQSPLLFYFWVPHWAVAEYDISAVQLPPTSPACLAKAPTGGVDCDYPPDHLFKALWPGLAIIAPTAHTLLTSLQLTTAEQIAIMGAIKLQNQTTEQAVRAWLAQNETTWRAWLPAPH